MHERTSTSGTVLAPLVQHLLAQSAPRAAARLSSTLGCDVLRHQSGGETCPLPYTVPRDIITLVDSAQGAHAFTMALQALLVGPPITLALDLEWQPDSSQASPNRPSLLQLATQTKVWLLDLEVPTRGQMKSLIQSRHYSLERHRVLGFGLQSDLCRLQSMYHRDLVANAVVDLRDAAAGSPMTLGSDASLRAAPHLDWTDPRQDDAVL